MCFSRTNVAMFRRAEEYENEEPWSSYMERIDAFFNANSIEDDVKKEWIFLLTVGASTYAMPGTLFAPAKPEEKSGNSEQHISSAP